MDKLDEAKAVMMEANQDGSPEWTAAYAQMATAYALIALVERLDKLTIDLADYFAGDENPRLALNINAAGL